MVVVVVMDGQRFINAAFTGSMQHAEIISVPDRMVGLSKYCTTLTLVHGSVNSNKC